MSSILFLTDGNFVRTSKDHLFLSSDFIFSSIVFKKSFLFTKWIVSIPYEFLTVTVPTNFEGIGFLCLVFSSTEIFSDTHSFLSSWDDIFLGT